MSAVTVSVSVLHHEIARGPPGKLLFKRGLPCHRSNSMEPEVPASDQPSNEMGVAKVDSPAKPEGASASTAEISVAQCSQTQEKEVTASTAGTEQPTAMAPMTGATSVPPAAPEAKKKRKYTKKKDKKSVQPCAGGRDCADAPKDGKEKKSAAFVPGLAKRFSLPAMKMPNYQMVDVPKPSRELSESVTH